MESAEKEWLKRVGNRINARQIQLANASLSSKLAKKT